MNNPILAVTLGEWLEVNAIPLLVFLGSLIAAAIKIGMLNRTVHELEAEVETMKADQRRVNTKLANHISDTDKHVNHLYMRSIQEKIGKMDIDIDKLETTMNGRMDKIEVTMNGQHNKVMDKLDVIVRNQ